MVKSFVLLLLVISCSCFTLDLQSGSHRADRLIAHAAALFILRGTKEVLEGMARIADQILAPAEGFGQGFFFAIL